MAVQFDATWTASRQQTVSNAMGRIQMMLIRAYLSVKAVSDAAATGTYTTHFGHVAYRHSARSVVRLMYERVTKANQTLTMSYVPTLLAFQGLNVGALPLGVNFNNVEAFVVQLGVAPSAGLTVYVCPAFFTGNVYIPNAVNQRTGTGTILHELSHGVGDTKDHAYTYDATYGTLTPMQRVTNADTYRAYCQAFDQ